MANLPFWVRSGDLERFLPKTTDMAVFYVKIGRNMVVSESWSFFLENGSKLGEMLYGRVIMAPHVSPKKFQNGVPPVDWGAISPRFCV